MHRAPHLRHRRRHRPPTDVPDEVLGEQVSLGAPPTPVPQRHTYLGFQVFLLIPRTLRSSYASRCRARGLAPPDAAPRLRGSWGGIPACAPPFPAPVRLGLSTVLSLRLHRDRPRSAHSLSTLAGSGSQLANIGLTSVEFGPHLVTADFDQSRSSLVPKSVLICPS